jgi:hypothetical protein
MKYMKCFREYKGAVGNFFQIIYIYQITILPIEKQSKKPIIRLYIRSFGRVVYHKRPLIKTGCIYALVEAGDIFIFWNKVISRLISPHFFSLALVHFSCSIILVLSFFLFFQGAWSPADHRPNSASSGGLPWPFGRTSPEAARGARAEGLPH